ncbi:hypothetical protein X802_07370 [Thermococcus guaymasensis DSM 11113]|uniref:Uncharacterized protein n=1 Tax=Thermococcus guaymasensis DSM 11113 TaxID=1432656 RepID=A0A0X1KL82_9EURY|nr:DUF2226 domain-containing protein [Thermococcus guaymasensis]AJC71995.1 hypothetical protein X802_07370 [Thermococcus guaymasensis DSM 11113]
MKLPDTQPIKENAVVVSPQDLAQEIKNAISQSAGAFLKVFGKKGNSKYYLTVLFDRSKVLAAEGQELESGAQICGEDVIHLLKELMGGPIIIDVYSLDEVGIKLSIAENLEIYSKTPKIPIEKLFGETQSSKAEKPKKAPEKPKSEPPEKSTAKKPAPEEKPKPSVEKPQKAEKTITQPGETEVVIEIPGGEVLKDALKEYTKHLISEAKRIRTLQINKIVYSGELSEGVVYLNVHMYGHSEGQMREVAEKRMLHAISKHAPIILRIADIKPILKEIKVILDGKEVAPQEIVEKDKKKVGKVDKEGRITLAVLEDVWPYFSAMARTVVGELNSQGISVKSAIFDVPGRREFEINAKLVVETSLPQEQATKTIRDTITRHAKELGRALKKYITVHTIDVEFLESVTPNKSAAKIPITSKAAEILQKKADLEREVEKLLQQAGVEELAFLTEEKKRESEKTLLKSRVEPAMEELKNRLHAELKLIPRVTFKWLKLNWDIKDTTVYLDIEASFMKEEIGGLFGSFSSVDENKIKQNVRETILRVIQGIQKDYGIKLSLTKFNVIIR